MAWLDKIHHPEKFIKTFLKWGLLGLIMGISAQADEGLLDMPKEDKKIADLTRKD